jgi:hypothetical protein
MNSRKEKDVRKKETGEIVSMPHLPFVEIRVIHTRPVAARSFGRLSAIRCSRP